MCLSKAYIESNGDKQLLLEEVASVEIDGSNLLLKTLFGDEKAMRANIKKIDFLTHSILLDMLEG